MKQKKRFKLIPFLHRLENRKRTPKINHKVERNNKMRAEINVIETKKTIQRLTERIN